MGELHIKGSKGESIEVFLSQIEVCTPSLLAWSFFISGDVTHDLHMEFLNELRRYNVVVSRRGRERRHHYVHLCLTNQKRKPITNLYRITS